MCVQEDHIIKFRKWFPLTVTAVELDKTAKEGILRPLSLTSNPITEQYANELTGIQSGLQEQVISIPITA